MRENKDILDIVLETGILISVGVMIWGMGVKYGKRESTNEKFK